MAAVPCAAKRHLEKLHELSLRFVSPDAPPELQELGDVLDTIEVGLRLAIEDIPAADDVSEALRVAVKAVSSM